MKEVVRVVTVVTHPKTKDLKAEILRIEQDGKLVGYAYDIEMDWYNSTWCENPLEDCINHAARILDEKYKGTYYEPLYDEERRLFNTCTY